MQMENFNFGRTASKNANAGKIASKKIHSIKEETAADPKKTAADKKETMADQKEEVKLTRPTPVSCPSTEEGRFPSGLSGGKMWRRECCRRGNSRRIGASPKRKLRVWSSI